MTESISLGKISVTIGMPVDNPIPHRTVIALCSTVQKMALMDIPCEIAMEVSGVVQIGRDSVLDDFLKNGTDKLFWIDSDMVWTDQDFLRMLALSTKYDVIGAAYPAKVEGQTTFYVNVDATDELVANDHGLIPVNGLGLGFTIVSRKVCEELAAKAQKVNDQITGREMAMVFRVDTIEGRRRTEDMAFFADIRDLGYTVWCDPTIELGHVGEREWRGRFGEALAQV